MRERFRLRHLGIAALALLTAGLPSAAAAADDIDYTLGDVTTVAGDPAATELGDGGPATDALINGPTGFARDADGNLYITSQDGLVRTVDSAGTITTFAGDPMATELGDGGPATEAQFAWPFDIEFDDAGNAYVSDYYFGLVRKIDTDGVISTYAGDPDALEFGDGGPATEAYLGEAAGLVWHNGELYIATGTLGTVRKVAANGTISTVAGIEDGGGGAAALAPLEEDLGFVIGLDVDTNGGLYITGGTEGAGRIWRLDIAADDLVLVAGREPTVDDVFPEAYGDGGLATDAFLGEVYAVDVHPSGGFVFAGLGTVRAVDADGIVTTIAGEHPGSALGPVMLQGTDLELETITGLFLEPDDTLLLGEVFAGPSEVWRLVLEDVTDPVVVVEVPAVVSRFGPALASVECSDNRPGVVCSGVADGDVLDTGLVNPPAVGATGTDAAGNVTSVTASYVVDWEITGSHAGSSGTEATIARLYAAYFGRLAEPGGFAYWEGELSADPEALIAASNFFSESAEFQSLYGSISNEAFVTLIYNNVMGRAPEPAGFDFWVLQLEQESFTRGEVMLFFSQSDEFKALTGTG